MIWHCHSLGLAHVLCMFSEDSQRAVTLMWAMSPLAGHSLLPSVVAFLQSTVLFAINVSCSWTVYILTTKNIPVFFWSGTFQKCWVFQISHFSPWHNSTPARFLCMGSCLASGELDSLQKLSPEHRAQNSSEEFFILGSSKRNTSMQCILDNDWWLMVIKSFFSYSPKSPI